MFDPQISVDSVFDVLGVDAILDPDGAALPVRLVPSREDDSARYGSVEILDASGVFEIRKADFEGHGDGLVLEVDGARRKVQSHEVRDQRRLKVVLNTVEVV